MPSVKVRENEPFESALRRFKRLCEKAGINSASRRRARYEKKSRRRQREKAAAVKRFAKKMQKEALPQDPRDKNRRS